LLSETHPTPFSYTTAPRAPPADGSGDRGRPPAREGDGVMRAAVVKGTVRTRTAVLVGSYGRHLGDAAQRDRDAIWRRAASYLGECQRVPGMTAAGLIQGYLSLAEAARDAAHATFSGSRGAGLEPPSERASACSRSTTAAVREVGLGDPPPGGTACGPSLTPRGTGNGLGVTGEPSVASEQRPGRPRA